jgi:hypothetical protein
MCAGGKILLCGFSVGFFGMFHRLCGGFLPNYQTRKKNTIQPDDVFLMPHLIKVHCNLKC